MPRKQPAVPKKYLGKWIAWDHGNRKIVASGKTARAALKAAKEVGEGRPFLEKVPTGLFVGRA